MLRIHEIKLKPGEDIASIPKYIEKKLGLKWLVIDRWQLIKESVDARDKADIRLVYSVDFTVSALKDKRETASAKPGEITALEQEVLTAGEKRRLKIAAAPDMRYRFATEDLICEPGGPEDHRETLKKPPVVVGFGPCGMFAALLLAQMGYRPLVLERGKAIDDRVLDVERFWREGVLDMDSNVQFGEGGAGSFSDGKLTTQIKDKRIRKVLEELAAAGGGEELLYRQKPHVGTDVLRDVVKNIRHEIIRLGGEIQFDTCLTEILFKDGENVAKGEGSRLAALKTSRGEKIETEVAALALGHSARDTFRALYGQGIHMEQKPFSMGVRIEHPQHMINESQYGKEYGQQGLDAADYKLSYRCQNGRGVYTFCMCPGGRVIASASQRGGVVTNGMSYRDRGLDNANSALLTDIRTEDFDSDHPLAGINFQERYERLAFEAGGGGYKAPAQRAGDFLARGDGAVREDRAAREDGTARYKEENSNFAQVKPSYEPGVVWTSLDRCLPGFVAESLREALPSLGKKLSGFDRDDAVLTAVESRSSSPVRIPRSDQLMCNVHGVYPGGEGAGFAGGITSAAVDGIRIAEAIARRYRYDG